MKGADESRGMIPIESHVANAMPSPMDKTCKLMAVIFVQKYFFILLMIYNYLYIVNMILNTRRSFRLLWVKKDC